MADRLRDLAFNALSEALAREERWVPLSGRRRSADRVVAVALREAAEEVSALCPDPDAEHPADLCNFQTAADWLRERARQIEQEASIDA